MGNTADSGGRAAVKKSGCVPASTWAQAGQRSQAANRSSGRASHNSALANSTANNRLPTPGGPTNR